MGTVRRQTNIFLRNFLWLALVLMYVTLLSTAMAQQGGTAKYTYDDNGRLKSVLLPTGEMVIYSYDAAGNITAINRQTILTLTGFTPASGLVGARITLTGTGFSTTPGNNTVKFNGVQANVISATLTQLAVDVPAGATTGLITVTNPNGSVTSASPFVVVSAIAPTIISFSPAISPVGTVVTISGANFDATAENNIVKFNGRDAEVTASTSTSITTIVPNQATSGKISVTTPGGTAVSPTDFFVGSPGAIETTGRMNIGESRALSFTTGNDALLIFEGIAGQKISATFTVANLGDFFASLVAPDGSQLAFSSFEVNPLFIDAVTLPATGTYTLWVSPRGSTGNVTVNLFNVVDVNGTISIDGPSIPLQISTPGQNARFSFTANANQRLLLKMTGVTIQGSNIAILDPDGIGIAFAFAGTDGGLVRTGAVPVSGTYTLIVDPSVKSTGNMTLSLVTQPAEATGNLTIGGAAVTVTINTPGQDAAVSFDGVAGQHLNLQISPVTIPGSQVSILNPDGTELVAATFVDTRGWSFDLPNLSATGTYRIRIVPEGANTGNMTLTLSAFAPTPIIPGGASVQVNLTIPNQHPTLSFNGTAGQRVSLYVPSMTLNQCTIEFFDANGTSLSSTNIQRLANRFIDVQTLPATGAYAIVVTPQNSFETGNVTMILYDVPADISGTITPGGAPVTVNVAVPGQAAQLSFNGTAGQRISMALDYTGSSVSQATIYKPDGTVLAVARQVATNARSFIDPINLPVSGTYTIVIDPINNLTGSITATLYDIVDVTGTISVGGSAVPVTINTPGQDALLTFDGTSGQQVTVRVTGNTICSVIVSLRRPNGTVITSGRQCAGTFNLSTQTLSETGIFTVRIHPENDSTGNLSVRITSP
jgi:YD repeat-containing protein